MMEPRLTAYGVRGLMNLGHDTFTIANALGIPESVVSNLLAQQEREEFARMYPDEEVVDGTRR